LDFQILQQAIDRRCFANFDQFIYVSKLLPSLILGSSNCRFVFIGILLLSGKHLREFCPITISSKLRDAKRRKILLAPDEARHGRDDIVLERSYRSKFGNETLMQFLEVSPIFAREDSGRGVAAVFEGWMNLIYWSWHGTLCTSNHTLKAWEFCSRSVLPPFAPMKTGTAWVHLLVESSASQQKRIISFETAASEPEAAGKLHTPRSKYRLRCPVPPR